MAEELKVAVLGAGGTIAPAIVRDLAESDEVSGMLLLDLDEDRAAEVAERHGGGKAKAKRANARAAPSDHDSVTRAIGRCDVLVNSASFRVNLDAMAACLNAGRSTPAAPSHPSAASSPTSCSPSSSAAAVGSRSRLHRR